MRIKDQIEKVQIAFPELIYNEEAHTLKGELEAFPNDVYTVLIELDPWSTHFPRVYEIGERIPKKIDRHVYTTKGNCCFTTPRLEEIYLKTKVKTLLQFVQHIVLPYLQNNSYYEHYQEYKFGEFSHTDSTLESYQTLLGVEDRMLIYNILLNYYNGKKLTAKSDCYCGSKRTLRKCTKGNHKRGYELLKYIDKEHMASDIKILIREIVDQSKRDRNI
ncbi:MAG: hypothetical protein AAF617_02545 [Bacteroidota bacterium]